MQLEPGTVGIKFKDDGQITAFTEKAQQSLRDAKVDENWKIIKIGSEQFAKKLLIKKARGSEKYTMEFVYTGDRQDVTTWILNFELVELFWREKSTKNILSLWGYQSFRDRNV